MPYFCVECPEKKHATYGLAGEKPTHCSNHGKVHGFIDVVNKRCEYTTCEKNASCGVQGGTRTHCAKHKLPTMIDVVNKRCEHDTCDKHASYGVQWKRPTRCAKHKLLTMIDVVSKRCEHDMCDKIASCGIIGKRPTRCAEHKLPTMIDVVHKRCEHDTCDKHASYGVQWKRPTRCAEHKLPTMIDVVNKRCEHDTCDKHASYGVQWKRPTRCAEHKLPHMIDVRHKRCKHDTCNKFPVFGISGQGATHCADHKSDRMFDFTNPLCSSCTITRVHHKGDLCATCDQFLKNNGASRRTRQKEMAVIQALQAAGLLDIDNVHIYEVTYNKSIGTSCGGYRPDILIDCGAFFIIIECDEFQHRSRIIQTAVREIGADGLEHRSKRLRTVSNYDVPCELTRMINIRLAKGVPCHIIRINPDAFKVDGATVRVPIKTRHAALCDQVKLAISTPPSSDLVVTYMYYDDALLHTEIVKLPPGYVWNV